MKFKYVFLVLAMLSCKSVFADSTTKSGLMQLGMPAPLANFVDDSYSGAIGNDEVFTGTAQVKYPAAPVITPAVTYAASLGVLSSRSSIIAAGAPTSAFVALPAITANVGRSIRVYNQGSNPLQIVPSTGVVNVSAALTPFSCATLKDCECVGLTTGVWGCSSK